MRSFTPPRTIAIAVAVVQIHYCLSLTTFRTVTGAMRETDAAHDPCFISTSGALEDDANASLDEDNHNGVSILGDISMLSVETAQPAGEELQTGLTLPSGFASFLMSDEDAGMSSDGGVPLEGIALLSETLSGGAAIIDVVGIQETNTTTAGNIALSDVDMDHFSDNEADEVEGETHIVPPPWTIGDDGVFAFGHAEDTPAPETGVDDVLQDLYDELDDIDELTAPHIAAAFHIHGDTQNNLSLLGFLYHWSLNNTVATTKKPSPTLAAFHDFRSRKATTVHKTDLRGDKCDFQGINWKRLGVRRQEARKLRNGSYQNYRNLTRRGYSDSDLLSNSRIDNDGENFFKFRLMDFNHKINLAHFQLRNLVACTSKNNVFYAGESRVYQMNPIYRQKFTRMDLTEPEVQSSHGLPWSSVQISTIAADHGILIAGGFHGEYGMMSLNQPDAKHVEGLVVDHPNCITNHMQVQISRQSGLPEAVIASNDHGLRALDCTSNKFVKEHSYEQAINCSAQSPDFRLRVLVGDTCDVIISNADTGEVLQRLDGHDDYGFACAWADNGWHVATGNQDKLVKIWDARMWTRSDGKGKPLTTISSTMAGVRSLKYSPLGSGKRVLLAAEPADILSVIDAETYTSKQTLDLFGEIAGADFSPDGQEIYVGVHDDLKGGIMEFEKCGHGRTFEHRRLFQRRQDNSARTGSEDEEIDMLDTAGLDWKQNPEDTIRRPNKIRTATHRRRRAARLGDMDPY